MTDVHSRQQRSRNMAAIQGKNTKPEKRVRSLLHSLGYRFRLHATNLPGKPDILFSGRQKIIFVHGCFWHVHRCRYGKVKPASNPKFWRDKRGNNKLRDARIRRTLRRRGWKLLTVWECWTKKQPDRLVKKLTQFLES